MIWINLEPVIQSEVSQKEKGKYHTFKHTCEIYKDAINNPTFRAAKETEM